LLTRWARLDQDELRFNWRRARAGKPPVSIDLSYLLDHDGVFLPLRDPEFFRKVDIYPEGDTIFWPGEVDICPDTLYAETQDAAGVAA
jgi:Protein of unknown function (DUF2442)